MEALTPREAITALSRLKPDEPILIGWWTRDPFENDLAESNDPDFTWSASLNDISGGFDYENEAIYGAIQTQINTTIEQEN